MKEYNPNWPFPQFDEDGKQLLPPDWNKRKPEPKVDLKDCEDALF
jgi:hypothetical protein